MKKNRFINEFYLELSKINPNKAIEYAFEHVFEETIKKIAFSTNTDYDLAYDLIMEKFLQIMYNNQFKGNSNFKSYFYRCCYNHVVEYHVRQKNALVLCI